MRQGNCHEKPHIKFAKNFGMRKVAMKLMSHCLSKNCKTGIQDSNIQDNWRHIVLKLCFDHLFQLKWNLTSIY